MTPYQKMRLLVFAIFSSMAISACSLANEPTEKNADSIKNDQHVYLVGEKQQMRSFANDFQKVSEADKPLDEGDSLYNAGKYSEAKEKYLLSITLLNKYGMKEAFHQWVARWKLADVYEKLNDKANAIDTLDWLIKHCQNEETKKGLEFRKTNLSAASQSSEKQQSSEGSQVYVFEPKEAMKSFSTGLTSASEAYAPMREAEKLYDNGKYEEATHKYLLSLKLHQEKKMFEWLPRYGLADTYEKLGRNAEAVEQLSWLISKCQNDETKKTLLERKNRLLK